ncbi:substrate-binding periplasmic protein [Allohahella marinimesophila]|uniref:Transporter substrate-binding domain-containing protein n=1 Tax=Allohahella marinimesophila TaxID=1054972 RepID=A0ABP7NKX3_9GAMM
MKRGLKFLTVLLCQSVLSAGVVLAEPMTVLTTDFPPYSFSDDGKVSGLSTEIVQAILARANIQTTSYKVYPWARAYTLARTGRNTLIFSIARSTQREDMFQWVGPLAPYQINLYKLRSRKDIRIEDVQQAKLYQVGGEYLDIKQLYLKSEGFEEDWNIELERTAALNVRKLFAGRIDLLPVSSTSLPFIVRKEGFDPADLEVAISLDEISSPLYMAFSLDVPSDVVARAELAFRALTQEGVIQDIHAAYTQGHALQ